jgi:hypothetical protein
MQSEAQRRIRMRLLHVRCHSSPLADRGAGKRKRSGFGRLGPRTKCGKTSKADGISADSAFSGAAFASRFDEIAGVSGGSVLDPAVLGT